MPAMNRVAVSRRRRLASAALFVLTIWSGTGLASAEALAWADGPSWEHLVAMVLGLGIYADPFKRIWPRRRVMVADLPRLRRELHQDVPNALPEWLRRP
jgi:hypothetical protein